MMQLFLAVTCLLCISGHALGKKTRTERSNDDTELSYQDLRNLNISCYPLDSCEGGETKDDYPFPEYPHRCSCHSECWKYGTCCIDSPYRAKYSFQKCLPLRYGSDFYIMVHRCPYETHQNSTWKILCERESYDDNDILTFSPVTSLDTSQTYKNYYCFKCHETTTNYALWNLKLEGMYSTFENGNVHSVTYNQAEGTWVADLVSIPVYMEFEYPQNVHIEPISCDGYYRGIDDCPMEWTDKQVREKCLSYSAIVYTRKAEYITFFKNVHCALCNDESLNDLTCNRTGVPPPRAGLGGTPHIIFRTFMDLNIAEKNKEERTCKDEKCVFNPYSNQCQNVKRLPTEISTEICSD